LKHKNPVPVVRDTGLGSIHPQGWVPIETQTGRGRCLWVRHRVAFTPKGGCPLKLPRLVWNCSMCLVAFTPKGGCPLKPSKPSKYIETITLVAFTPKGGCPLKPEPQVVRIRRVDRL